MGKIQKKSKPEIVFKVKSKLGLAVSTTKAYWKVITHVKHPSVQGKEKYVKETFVDPDEIRVSRKDHNVYLFYKKYRNKFLCVIARIKAKSGYIITAYYTKKIKEGQLKWKK